MLIFMLGEPKSGKSVFVENILTKLQFSSVLYVGTIPYTLDTRPIIEAHRIRRPHQWLLYECTGNLSEDLVRISAYVGNIDAILIDGLTYYMIESMYMHPDYSLESIKELMSFFRLLRETSTRVIVIDHYNSIADAAEYNSRVLLHKIIRKYANICCVYSVK